MTIPQVIRVISTEASQTEQLRRVKVALVRVVFLIGWLPSVIASVVFWVQGKSQLPLVLYLLLVIWHLVEYLTPPPYNKFASIILAQVILYMPVFEPRPSTPSWYIITLAGVATTTVSALYAPWPLSLLVVGIGALVEHAVITVRLGSSLNPDAFLLHGWIAPLWLLLLGLLVAHSFRRLDIAMAEADRLSESLEALNAREALARALHEERSLQQRRLHETVLNTLASLVRKGAKSIQPTIYRLRDEIAEARAIEGLNRPTSMFNIVRSALPALGDLDPRIDIIEGEDILLPRLIARDVRDALAELIRNAIKHSRGTRVLISWEVSKAHLSIKVIDDGVGMANSKSTGLGLGRILPEILRDLSARMSIRSDPRSGTEVLLMVPLETHEIETPTEVPKRALIAELDSASRVVLFAPAISVVIAGWWLIQPFEPKPVLVALLLGHVVSVLAAATDLRAPHAWILMVIGLSTGLAILGLISFNTTSCANVSRLQWIANFLCTTTTLGLVFYGPQRLRAVIIPLTTLALFLIGQNIPEGCGNPLLVPAMALLALSILVFALWQQGKYWTTSVIRGQLRRDELTRRRIEQRVNAYRSSQWFTALGYLDRFVDDIESGTLTEDVLSMRAHIEEQRLRARIQLDPFVNGAFARLALDLVNVAAENDWTPTITVVETSGDATALPVSVSRALIELCADTKHGPCQLTLYLEDEQECLSIVSPSSKLSGAADVIGTALAMTDVSSSERRISMIFETLGSEAWLEIRRTR